MQKIIFSLVLLLSALTHSAQKLSQEKGFWGPKYFKGEEKISQSQLLTILKSEDYSANLAAQYKTNYTVAQVLAFPAGALMGWPIGGAIGGGEFNVAIFSIGLALITTTYILSSRAERQLKKSIAAYNQGLPVSALQTKHPKYLSVVGNSQGIGLAFNF